MYVGDQFQPLSVSAKAGLSGFCSGFSETAVVCPFEVIKVRMQNIQHVGKNVGKYTGTFHLRTVVKEEGLGALYSGAAPMAARNCVFNAIFFGGSYMMWEQLFPNTGKETPLSSFGVDICCGLFMGCVATPPKMPFFAVKTRLQGGGTGMASLQGMNTVQIMRLIVREEGIASLGGAVCLSAFLGIMSQLK
mmetsp:Transcript_3537/g.9356  ORF Transcript_3537/g.9356 Transcript_3537/m.9356 type:complete len:191 (+) Transcript_3537:2081-2653(+)